MAFLRAVLEVSRLTALDVLESASVESGLVLREPTRLRRWLQVLRTALGEA